MSEAPARPTGRSRAGAPTGGSAGLDLTASGMAAGGAAVLGLLMVVSGGLGLVTVTGLVALVGLVVAVRRPRELTRLVTGPGGLAVLIAGLALTVWVAGSIGWSPVGWGEAARTMLLQLPLGFLVIMVLAGATRTDRLHALRGLVALVGGAAFLLTMEALNGYQIMRMANPAQDVLELERTLGRGSVAVAVMGVMAALAAARLGLPRPVSLGMLVLAGFVATRFGMDMNLVLFAIAILAAGAAWIAPRLTLGAICGLAALAVVAAPVLYARLAQLVFVIWPDQNGPLSYERRAQMWQFAIERIGEKPVKGWGLDASRTFDGVISYRGFEWADIQLHPHASPLQIWLELGAVGACLTGLLLGAAGWGLVRLFGQDRLAAAAVASALAALFAAFGFSFGFWQPWLWSLMLLAVGFAVAMRRIGSPLVRTLSGPPLR